MYLDNLERFRRSDWSNFGASPAAAAGGAESGGGGGGGPAEEDVVVFDAGVAAAGRAVLAAHMIDSELRVRGPAGPAGPFADREEQGKREIEGDRDREGWKEGGRDSGRQDH
jgi:hypothetical protein